jgi:hypothetical protein
LITLFERYGTPHNVKEGTTQIALEATCNRCGGAGGADKWKPTGWTCFDCGGSGKSPRLRIVKLYTREQIEKLDARKAKADAKRAAARLAKAEALEAERVLKRDGFRASHPELVAWAKDPNEIIRDIGGRCLNKCYEPSDAQIELVERIMTRRELERRAAEAGHLGKIGERLELTVRVEKKIGLGSRFYGSSRTRYIMRDEATGANVTWVNTGGRLADEGQSLRIKGTVKDHGFFRDLPQTVLSRVRAVEVRAA